MHSATIAYIIICILCVGTIANLGHVQFVEGSDGTTVASGGSQNITGPNSICKAITNGRANSIYIPTTTSAEWASFYAPGAVQTSITYGACPPPCAGYKYGGYCFYATAAAQSCTGVCASHGGCNLAGTQYAGSSGTYATCVNIVAGLGFNTAVDQQDNYNGWADGCNYYWSNSWGGWHLLRSTSPATTCEFVYSGAYGYEYRICACNQ